MAKDAQDDLEYFLLIDSTYLDDLAVLRKWNHLKVAIDGNSIWISNFDLVQITSVEVKCIPYKTLFYTKQGKLFMLNSLLPDRKIPSFLWTPIERALPIKIESFNHNYFGLNEEIPISLVTDNSERESVAMITRLLDLKKYVDHAPKFRLNQIKWILLSKEEVLLIGTPLLPLQGTVFWSSLNSLLPAGHNFNLKILAPKLSKKLDPGNDHWIVWDHDSQYFMIPKLRLRQLSISSVQNTFDSLADRNQETND